MDLLLLAINALKFLILADVILSWVMPDKNQFPRSLTTSITDPLYAPLRAILNPQKTGGLDFSPFVIIFILIFFENMLEGGTRGAW